MGQDLVLSDELLKEFYDFKHSQTTNKNISLIMKLLHFYKSHLTNVKQFQRVGLKDKVLLNGLAQNGLTNQSLEELASQTSFKVILNTKIDDFPYINIHKDKIENNFTSTYYKTKGKVKAQKHIKALLKEAKTIFIYDKYFKNNWNNSKQFFTDLLPKKYLKIFFIEEHLEQKHIKEMKEICKQWIIKKDVSNKSHRDLHDRYLIIDEKIEILLSSGFDNLFTENKDFTYIIRKLIKKN